MKFRSNGVLYCACFRTERFSDFKTDCPTASIFSVVQTVRGRHPPFLITDPVSLKFFFIHNIIDLRSGTAW